MRVAFELGASEVRDLARKSMQLHDICIFDIAKVGLGTPLEDPKDWGK
jgi:hypothetical protein